MANNIVIAEANRLLDASLGTTTYVPPTGPMKLALETSTGSNASPGVEVVGGSYARQTITFSAASGGTAASSNSIVFTAMPAATVAGAEVYDSNGTPRRGWVGALGAGKTVASGDSLSFAVAAVTIQLL
jgi:hypothetical protein